MDKLLLVVEESFQITRLGLILTPDVSPEVVGSKDSSHMATIRLVRPNGSEETMEATFYWEHLNVSAEVLLSKGLKSFIYVCVLRAAIKEQVPAGTQVWLLDEMAHG